MSIKTEIDRIKQSKADIISALKTKGVTVPSDASIDDLSALIQAIEVGSDPVLQTKSATPKTSSQTIKPDSGYDGLSQVTISAVTSSIDSDIKASNIKKGVNILGVTGTLESGITPTGTMSITSNGTYDVTNYASASVNVSGGGSGGDVPKENIDVTVNLRTSADFFNIPNISSLYYEEDVLYGWLDELSGTSNSLTIPVARGSIIHIIGKNITDDLIVEDITSGLEATSNGSSTGVIGIKANEPGTVSIRVGL